MVQLMLVFLLDISNSSRLSFNCYKIGKFMLSTIKKLGFYKSAIKGNKFQTVSDRDLNDFSSMCDPPVIYLSR